MIKLGSKVRWNTTAKISREGVVIHEVAPNETPCYLAFHGSTVKVLEKIWAGEYKSALVDGMQRGHKSFLVLVTPEKGKPIVYWPRLSALTLIDEQ